MMESDLVIIGGGPAGMMAGLLFARAGVRTTVLEKHSDFLRDFRGDTVHPSTLTIFHELGLLDDFLTRPHQRVEKLSGRVAGRDLKIVDFSHLPGPAPFIALMPQWDLLDYLAEVAGRYPGFTLIRNCAGKELIEENGRITGVRTEKGEVRARLVMAADGRDSGHRDGLPVTQVGAPMDVFWFRIAKETEETNNSMGVFEPGRICVLIDRSSYWQVGYVFPKGHGDTIRAQGLPAFLERVRSVGPETTRVAESIQSWDDVKLLTVTVDRLERWHKPGLLVIGDAAHAMSPIGGVGINLAIQDAVAAANHLADPMARSEDVEPLLGGIYDRRIGAVRLTQAMQKLVQDQIIQPALASTTAPVKPPLALRVLDRIELLRRIPARLVGLGVRPEHVQSSDVYLDLSAAPAP